jgi:competence protein ComEA
MVERIQWIGAGLLLVLAIGAGTWYARSAPEPPPVVVSAETAFPDTLTLHVSGAVVSPGLVEVTRDARVADVILAAGGALGDADLSALNLAARVVDGQQLMVPRAGSGGDGGGAAGAGKVPINSAGEALLQELPGVGPVLAERILRHREEHGPFAVVEDLLDVPGIGEGKLAALRDVVMVP